ncbi:MAG: enoyl-CoA hydratase [Magnetospiraceae bacterium]
MDTNAPQTEPLTLEEVKGPIGIITFNRPDAFNALSRDMLLAVEESLVRLGNDRSVRAIILAGAGRAFCAGHDLKEINADPSLEAMNSLFGLCSKVMMRIAETPQPVIAQVHGVATAAGCQLVAACDLAVAAETARFATSGINVGLFCATPMVALTRNVPRKFAMEMLLTGAFIDAETALRYGLINRITPPAHLASEAEELAQVIANKSPASIAMGKRLFYAQIEAATAAAYDIAAPGMAENMQCEDAQAGIDAFANKRPMPDWKGK